MLNVLKLFPKVFLHTDSVFMGHHIMIFAMKQTNSEFLHGICLHFTSNPRQTRQDCMYNWNIDVCWCNLVAVEKQYILNILSVYVCSLSYPSCKVYAPYCHLWPVQHTMFVPIIL